jgi:HKD family nuclease
LIACFGGAPGGVVAEVGGQADNVPMRLITTSESLFATFKEQLGSHKKLSFAVAWASHGFPACKELLKHEKKIERGTVGIHFYQTDPDFIEHFLEDERIKFAKQASGTFHPKVYLFSSSKDDWSCLVGSANFTAAAFSNNSEACLVFEASDDPTGATRREIDKALAGYWKEADYFKTGELDLYRSLHELFRQKRRGMADNFDDKGKAKPLLLTPLIKMTWQQYFRTVLLDGSRNTDERIEVLGEARRLFEAKQSLAEMSRSERQGVAGFAQGSDFPWGWFGSMFGAGVFKKIVNANSQGLSRALDAIPSRGEVRKEHYRDFVKAYVAAFPHRRRHGLATATRLLTMKRPDYFVCYDSQNRQGLRDAFGIALNTHDYDRYWNSIIERILISEWWRSPRPTGTKATAVWDGRAAFLDSLYYKPKQQ